MSSRHPLPAEAARQYAEAYAVHYAESDLVGALLAYDRIIELHPNTPEADYSRSQIGNIVNRVVPAVELLASQVQLALQRLRKDDDESSVAVSR